MGRPRKVRPNWTELATIWTISDELWEVIAPILGGGRSRQGDGRPRVDARRTLDAILFRMRSGCQWNQLPERFPDDSSVHRTFQRWVRLGLFERLWAMLVDTARSWGEWTGNGKRRMERWARRGWGGSHRPQSYRPWQARGEAQPVGRGVRRAARDRDRRSERAMTRNCWPRRSKASWWSAHSLRRSARSTCVWTWAMTTRRGRPRWTPTATSRTCAASGRRSWICSTGEPRFPARRWVVERTLAWLSKCRALLVRYDKHAANFLGCFSSLAPCFGSVVSTACPF